MPKFGNMEIMCILTLWGGGAKFKELGVANSVHSESKPTSETECSLLYTSSQLHRTVHIITTSKTLRNVFPFALTHMMSFVVLLHPHPGNVDLSQTNLQLEPVPQKRTRT